MFVCVGEGSECWRLLITIFFTISLKLDFESEPQFLSLSDTSLHLYLGDEQLYSISDVKPPIAIDKMNRNVFYCNERYIIKAKIDMSSQPQVRVKEEVCVYFICWFFFATEFLWNHEFRGVLHGL